MNAIASPWLNLEIVMLSQLSQTEEEKYCMTFLFFFLYDISYMWNLKRNDTNKLTKQKEWINVYAFEVCTL